MRGWYGKRPQDAVLEKAEVALGQTRLSRDDLRLFLKVLRTFSAPSSFEKLSFPPPTANNRLPPLPFLPFLTRQNSDTCGLSLHVFYGKLHRAKKGLRPLPYPRANLIVMSQSDMTMGQDKKILNELCNVSVTGLLYV